MDRRAAPRQTSTWTIWRWPTARRKPMAWWIPTACCVHRVLEKRVGKTLEVERAQNWPVEPLVAGSWRTLRPLEQQQEAKRLTSVRKIAVTDVARVRALPLDFYDNTVLYEAELRPEKRTEWSAELPAPRRRNRHAERHITANSRIQCRRTAAPGDTCPGGRDLRFFTAAISGNSGNFRIVDGPGNLGLGPT